MKVSQIVELKIDNPHSGFTFARGLIANLIGGLGAPSKAIRPVFTIKRVGYRMVGRMWSADVTGRVWCSTAAYSWSLHEYAWLRTWSFFRRSSRIPRMWTVKR